MKKLVPIDENTDIQYLLVGVDIDTKHLFRIIEIGNNDGLENPGETIEIIIPLINYGNSSAYNVEATLSSGSELMNIVNENNTYGNINSNSVVNGTNSYIIELNEQIVKSDELLLNLDITNGLTTWQSLIDLNVEAGMIIIDHVELINNLELSKTILSSIPNQI